MVSVLNTIDTGHEDMIHCAEVDYYGLRLATCSSDNSVKIFDIKNGAQTFAADLRGHSGPVWQCSWSHPRFGNILATCSYDRKVIIWKELNEWIKWYEYNNHDSSVNSVAFAPPEHGLVLACGSSDGSISILSCNVELGTWDYKKISNAHSVGCNAVNWAPASVPEPAFDQRNVSSKASGGTNRLVSGGCDNLIKIWRDDGDRWIEVSRLEAHSDWVRDVAWSPGTGTPKSQIASCSQDRRVIIWTSEDFVNWNSQILHTFDDALWNVSWSLTGNILAVSGGDNKISLWRENNENQWTLISDDANASSTGHSASEQRTL